ncbi:MAG: class I SAM-dependent methyltransferase [Draconibacterium sp.]
MVESGIFYSTVLDPVLKQLRKKVSYHVLPNGRIIDIACGTGAQLFELTGLVDLAIGVDLSDSMIHYAKKMVKKRNLLNVDFSVADATNLSEFYQHKFDVAILSLALHQFEPNLRTPVLNEIQKISDKIIVLDYAIPLPKNYVGLASKVAEFLAGRSHNQNFKDYSQKGGLEPILVENGYFIQKSQTIGKGAFQLVVATNVF